MKSAIKFTMKWLEFIFILSLASGLSSVSAQMNEARDLSDGICNSETGDCASVTSETERVCIVDAPRDDCGEYGTQENECIQMGCCWDPKDNQPWCFSKTEFPPGSTCSNDAVRYDCGTVGVTESQCVSKGCCWSPSEVDGMPWCFYKIKPMQAECKANGPRFDCGGIGTTEDLCTQSGCCWDPKDNEPWCFYPSPLYIVTTLSNQGSGVKMVIEIKDSTVKNLPYGDNISPLVFELMQENNDRLHIKISDPNNQRWEVPESILKTPPPPSSPPASPNYQFSLPKVGEEFYFAIQRKSDMETIFNTSSYGVLQFSNQYISIGTSLPQGYNMYGLGERKDHFRLSPRGGGENCGNTFPMWSNDMPTIPENFNLYGVQPFYLELRGTTGNAHGVFLKNSNGMDVVLTEDSLQYKIIGGILDFYFFIGPQPEAVISQYLEVIGRPALPPYWALGFHQCRYGYNTLKELEDVIDGYAQSKIPLDVIWSDIDYMDQYKDFTLDPVRFPSHDVQSFIKDIHSKGLHYVVIIDPGIAIDKGYPAYDHGIAEDIFIKDHNGNLLLGSVWPGDVHFPDFYNPKTEAYWQNELSYFINDLANVDGIWIDMNECANFCDGFCSDEGNQNTNTAEGGFDPRNPPYNINNRCSRQPLSTRTLPVEATYYGGITDYNAHNLYGTSEAIATYRALVGIRPTKRPFVLTRSTYPGVGAYAAHWNGDNSATETDLYYSIPMMLSYQLFGIPFVGSDICGFFEDTSEELCARWMQLGAFYPFPRNHNFKDLAPQEPYLWDTVADVSRKALAIRYSLLPYYYTLFYKANRQSDSATPPSATVIRPLFFEFPHDSSTYPIDWQFMLGSAILISPVLRVGDPGKSVIVYFPPGVWYDWYTHATTSSHGSETITINTPLDIIPIHIRGGFIIPMQDPGLNTAESRNNLFSLLVALDSQGTAAGDIYVDDGESISNTNASTYVGFTASNNTIISSPTGLYGNNLPPLDRITVLGVASKPTTVTVNGQEVTFTYTDSNRSLLVGPNLKISLAVRFTVNWQ